MIFNFEFIIQIVSCATVIYTSDKKIALLFQFLALDSLFSSLNFLRIYLFNNDLSQSQTLTHLQSLYHNSYLDRYIYYLTLSGICRVMHFLFWMPQDTNSLTMSFIYYLSLISVCPIILNTIFHTYLSNYLSWIHKKQTLIMQTGIAYLLSSLINFMSESCVNLRPNVTYRELLPLFPNAQQSLHFFWKFLTNFLIATVLQYSKVSGNGVWTKVIRFFYNYKTGHSIQRINKQKAKEHFIHVIIHRSWTKLLSPDTLQTFFYIYGDNPENSLIGTLLTQGQYALLKITSIWTLASFLQCPQTVPIISLFLFSYKFLKENFGYMWSTQQIQDGYSQKKSDVFSDLNHPDKIVTENILHESYKERQDRTLSPLYIFLGEMIVKSMCWVLGQHTQQYLLLTVCVEYGRILLLNSSCIQFYQWCGLKFFQGLSLITKYNELNSFLISSCLFIKLINYRNLYDLQDPIGSKLILSAFGGWVFINLHKLKCVSLLTFLILGTYSNFSWYHSIGILILEYISINVIYNLNPEFFLTFEIIVSENKPEVYIKDVQDLKVYESYYQKSDYPPGYLQLQGTDLHRSFSSDRN